MNFDPTPEPGRPAHPHAPEVRPSLTTRPLVRGYSRRDRAELLAASLSLFAAAFVLITLYLVALS